ncbi:hypothetical protein JCM21900_003762 [Sporobolomyces salmonicolor]
MTDPTPSPDLAAPHPVSLAPELALELRVRFLETLLAPLSSSSSSSSKAPLARRISQVQSQLNHALEAATGSDAIRRFVQNYDLNSPLLSVAPLPASPSVDEVTPQAKVSLILEAEHEIRSLERDLREIEALEARGVVEAGKLAKHESLKEPLDEVRTAALPIAQGYASLEARTTALLQRYNDYISTLSELFVSWNDIISEAEDTVDRLEKERNKPLDIS